MRPTLTLALPIIVGQLSQMLMGVTDSVMIGHAGTVPLAASAFGGNVFAIFFVVGIGMMVPISIFVARARGAQRPDEAAEYLRHGVALALVFGLLETVAMAALSVHLHRFGQPPEVLAIVTPYFVLIAASVTPVLVYLVLRQFAEAMGHPWAPMFIMLGGVVLNVFLNWVFIFGHLGVPAMGLTGAGIATLASRGVGTLVIFLWLRRDPRVRAAWPSFATTAAGNRAPANATAGRPARWFGGYSRARWREMLHMGLPAAGMLLFESSAFAFSAFMVGWLGSVPLAAHQIAMSCASLAFMIPLGLSMATGMRVSHAVGSGERARLRPIAFGSLIFGGVVMAAFALAFGFAGKPIASGFVEDPAVISLAVHLLIVAAVFQLADGAQVIGAASLRGIMDVRVPAVITLVAYWGIALPLGYVLGFYASFGAVGVWSGIAGGLAFAAVFLNVRFARLTRAA